MSVESFDPIEIRGKAQELADTAQHSTAERIAEALKETQERPLWQLRKVVKCLGSEQALQLLAETEQIEQAGGMLVPDGSRRRTAGGVFFALARKRLPKGDRLRIFGLPAARPKAEATDPAGEPPPGRVEAPRPVEVAPLHARRRMVEVSKIGQYRPPALYRGEAKSPESPARREVFAQPPARREVAEDVPPAPQVPPPAPAEPDRPRLRRIVTVSDLKGHKEPSVEAAPEATAAPAESKGGAAEIRAAAGPTSSTASKQEAPTEAELRRYITGVLERQPRASRQRLLLDLLLDDLAESPVDPGQVALSTRLTVIMAHRLGYSVEAIAEQVFGDSSRQMQRRTESVLAKGVDFELLEQLLELTDRS